MGAGEGRSPGWHWHARGSGLLTFNRKVLGLGPRFLGPYSSISRSLEVLKKPKLQFSIATRQQHIYKRNGYG